MTLAGVPRIPTGMVPRARLSARLDAGAPLVVLRAPAGYGKTAALIAWAASSARAGAWVRVHPGIGGAASFVEAVAHALADADLVGPDDPLRTAADSVAFGDPFTLLLRGLRRRRAPLTLVIDEAEHLDDETVEGLLRLLSDEPSLALRVATRTTDGFTDAALGLSFELDVVGPEDLALRPAEAEAIVGTLGEDAVRYVLQHGASAALARIVALTGRTTAGGRDPRTAEAAVEALLDRRTRAWDDDLVPLLELVSLAEVADAPLAGVLTGRADAESLLHRAETEGLGYWRTADATTDGRPVFVVTPVFQRILAQRARTRLTAQERTTAHRAIARWHLAAGRAYPALEAAVAADDGALVTEVVRRHWSDLLRSAAEVRGLLRGMSPLALRTRPLPSMLLAILWNAQGAHRLRALEYFAIAAHGARTQRASAGPEDRALLGALESAAQRVSGRTEAAVRSAAAAQEVMDLLGADDHALLGRNVATVYNQIGLSFLYGGRAPEAHDAFRRSEAVGREHGLMGGIQGLANLAGSLALRGELEGAREAVARASAERWPEGWRDGYPGSLLQLAIAVLALEDGDDQGVLEALRPLARHRATIEHAGALQYVETLARLARGETSEAATSVARALDTHRGQRRLGGLGGRLLRHARVLVALAEGRPADAEHLVRALAAGADRDVARARVRLSLGDPDAALRILGAVDTAGHGARLRAEHTALTAGALALLAGNDAGRTAAREAAGRLDVLVGAQGLSVPLLLVPADALAAIDDVVGSAGMGLHAVVARVTPRAFLGSRSHTVPLTARERTVAQALVSGATVPEIAVALSVSPNTIKTQLRAVYRKLGVRSRDEAVRVLLGRGDLAPEGARTVTDPG